MAVKTKEEILSAVKDRLGDDNSDEALSFIADISDTYDDMSNQIAKSGEWKKKFEQNDADWRKKYRDRFFSKPETEPDLEDDADIEPEKKKPLTFDELFSYK